MAIITTTTVVEQVHSLLVKDIRVKDRMRKDLGDLSGLMDSIYRNGLTHPIVIDHDNFLIAGGRRLAAHEALGLERIKCIYKDQAPPDIQAEMEFEENFWRKSMTWQEECIGILNIYRKKKLASALHGWVQPVQQAVSQMFGMAIGRLTYVLAVARKLELEKDPNGRWHSFANAAEAYRLGILADEYDAKNKLNASLVKQQTNTAVQQKEIDKYVEEVKSVESAPVVADALAEKRSAYEANPLNKSIPFDVYWAEKQRFAKEAANTIFISNRFHFGDCIDYMNHEDNHAKFHSILTDPPYAIDMDNLDDAEGGPGLADVARVRDAHTVEENLDLLIKFFPAAWKCTRDQAWLCLCADPMMWHFLYQEATNAGWLVQRWPYLWRKVNQSIKNGAASYNTTKDYEIVMLCRKPGTVVVNKRNTSFTDTSNVLVTKETGHPFAKPYELTKDLADMISAPGHVILDPFAGGGAMTIQMLKMNRHVFACEKEEHWYNALLTNVKNLHYLKLNPNYIFK